jgi:signal transduction histidine kinase/CheY-like chemotaxis protein
MIKFLYNSSIKRRFNIYLVASIVLLIGILFLFNALTSNSNKALLKERLDQSKLEMDDRIAEHTAVQRNYLFDNSYWDDLVNFYKTRDTTWIKNKILDPLDNYKIDYLWYVETNMDSVISYKRSNKSFTRSLPPAMLSDLKSAFAKNTFLHFFSNIYGSNMELYTAPIHPSLDFKRTSRSLGFVIAGIIIDSTYISEFEFKNKGTSVFISNAFKDDLLNTGEANFSFYKPMIGLGNKVSFYLNVNKGYPDLQKFNKDFFWYSSLFLFSIIGILLLFYSQTIRQIYSPLSNIEEALNSSSKKPIEQLAKTSNEFGSVARLVNSSFDYNDNLLHEVETRRKSELNLQQALADVERTTIEKIKAENAAKTKSEFLSTISHEIRTPINGMIGIVNLLKDEALTPRQTEYLSVLDYSSKHLLALVSDVLDFSKIEAGGIEFEKASFDLNVVCNNVLNLFKAKAAEKGIELKYEPFVADISSLYGDNVRLTQILNNLVGNAVKFTKQGYVQLGYKVLSNTESNVALEFRIKDTGIGIDEVARKKIFEGFSQANNEISREYGGTGLGLTISKKLIEIQGGSISVESTVGVGTSFSFYLSFEKHAFVSSIPEPRVSKLTAQDLHGLSILVAEDNKVNAFVLQRFLQKWNVTYTIVENGAEAVARVQENNYDLILMDLQMPIMNGQEATSAIRKMLDSHKNKIPVIALTADAAVSTQELIMQNGFSHFVTKPFNPDSLYKVLKKYHMA